MPFRPFCVSVRMRPAASRICRLDETVDWGRSSAAAMSLTLTPGAAVQQPQDADAHRRSQAAQHLRPLLGIDHQEIARHVPLRPDSTFGGFVSAFRIFQQFPRLARRSPSRCRAAVVPGAVHVRIASRHDASPPTARRRFSLDGVWDFAFEGPTARLSGEGHRIRSPGIWQAQFPALAQRAGDRALPPARSRSRATGRAAASCSSWKACSTSP